MIFTCLSPDIVAHEVTHAILDSIHPRFIENTNPDVPAFHEAFADIVALIAAVHHSTACRTSNCQDEGGICPNSAFSENWLLNLEMHYRGAVVPCEEPWER